MDMRETSAMTEASGLVDDPAGTTTPASGARPGGETGRNPQSPHFDSRQAARRLSDRLREVTVKAPLQSLFVAFLLGVWMTLRR